MPTIVRMSHVSSVVHSLKRKDQVCAGVEGFATLADSIIHSTCTVEYF